MMSSSSLWQRFQKYFLHYGDLDVSIDISRMRFPDDFFEKMQPRIEKAFAAMAKLESGAIANPDEKRMVGHYWLRDATLAPNAELRHAIESTLAAILRFRNDVHAGRIRPERAARFANVLVVGIGGSALGPELVAAALTSAGD